jgi:hypothetical protein
MSAAIAALFAALAVVYKLSITTTNSQPVDTFLNVMLNLFNGQSRLLDTDEAMTILLYSIIIYIVVFSASYFILRFLAWFLVGFGLPDEQQMRRNRELRRGKGSQIEMLKRQARYTAQYTVRAQQAALVAQRRRQAKAARGERTSDPTPADFKL